MVRDYPVIRKYISAARLNKYEVVCKGNNERVLKLYQTNLRLSQAFYPLLSLFEVILRNAINEELTAYFTDGDWLKNQRTGFMIDPSLTYTNPKGKVVPNKFLVNSVNKSLREIDPITDVGKIISDLKLGFWVALFDNYHYKVLKGRPISIFKKLPPRTNRHSIYQRLDQIRNFRNRVYHNEPIIFEKDAKGNHYFSLKPATVILKNIEEFFQWLDLDYTKWTKRINNIPFEIKRAQCVMDHYPKNSYYFNRVIIGLKHYKSKYYKL